jgi:CRISP-associated protein Cas1
VKNLRALPKLRDSLSFLYLEHARLERGDSALLAFDEKGVTHVPVAALGALLLGPGTTLTHEAVKVVTENGCSIVWCGEQGVRTYAQGLGETRSSVRLLRQSALHGDQAGRMSVVLRMYEKRFSEQVPAGTTLEQIRGKEGVRVRTAYQQASRDFGVAWTGRNYERSDWAAADPVNRGLSCAAACLYGVCHCAVVAAGYSPALGFIHTGKLLSFVYDVADLYRVDLIVPVAFEVAALQERGDVTNVEREVRTRCREAFRKGHLLDRVVGDIDDLMQPNEAELERARLHLDGRDDPPAGLWDGGDLVAEGGVNHGPADS